MNDNAKTKKENRKTLWGDVSLVSGHNCVPRAAYIEMRTTKERFHKTDGRQLRN